MTDIVRRLAAWLFLSSGSLREDIEEAKQVIELLRQQLAESQAREKAALRHLQITSYHPGKDALFTLFENLDSTALDTLKRQWQREALLDMAETLSTLNSCEAVGEYYRKAKELE